MIIYSIYKLVNQQTGKCYIGFTQDLHKRMADHKTSSIKKRNKLYNSVRKYGWDSFVCEVLYQSHDGKHCLNTMEPHFIKEFDTFKNGYNSTNGGEGGSYKRTKKSKEKQSKSRKHRFNAKDKDGNIFAITNDDPRFISGELVGINSGTKATPEASKKMSLSRMGNKNRLGITHPESDKQKIKESMAKLPDGVCPHCGKTGKIYILKRNHFDKCKSIQSSHQNGFQSPAWY